LKTIVISSSKGTSGPLTVLGVFWHTLDTHVGAIVDVTTLS